MSKNNSTAPRSNQQLRRQRSKRLALAFLIMTAFLLSVGAPFTVRQLTRLNLLPQAQHFTGLSFANSQNLPKKYTPSVVQRVSFTIHNNEGQRRTYTYAVTQTNEKSDNIYDLKSGSVTLSAGLSKTITITVNPTDMGAHSKIVVSLSQPHQSISYWITRTAQ